jgi:hypothetical protein
MVLIHLLTQKTFMKWLGVQENQRQWTRVLIYEIYALWKEQTVKVQGEAWGM